jgi:hypothetical protein
VGADDAGQHRVRPAPDADPGELAAGLLATLLAAAAGPPLG